MSPQAGLGLASLPRTPRAPHSCCACARLAEPKWDVASGPGAAPSLSTPPPRSPPEGLEWATARRAGQGPNWNLHQPCLSLSSHSYKLSSRAIGTCKETVPDRWVPRGAIVLSVTKTPTPCRSRSLSGSAGLSSPGGHLTIRRGFRAHGGCSLDPPPCPHAQAPAPRLRHLDLNTQTPQARHCRPRALSSAEGVVIQLEIRRERSFTSPWWKSLGKWAGGGAQGRG